MDWKKYHCYRVFDEFIETFVLGNRSYITKHAHDLDLVAGLVEIKKRFVDNYDASGTDYDVKLAKQFEGASEDVKIIFSNIEYLWCMPVKNISPETKHGYLRRWFDKGDVEQGGDFYFTDPHTAADPGRWNNQNKFYEISCIIRIITLLLQDNTVTDLQSARQRIEEMCYAAIYVPGALNDSFNIKKKCATHSMLMHLSNPNKYEIIVSEADKEKILGVFGYALDEDLSGDREEQIKRIKANLYNQYAAGADRDRKERWFFYMDDVRPLWKNKNSKRERKESSVSLQIQAEVNASDHEGEKHQATGYIISRSSKLVKAAKRRDGYTCQACSFYFNNKVVQAHHLNPLSEREHPQETSVDDLVTLCPNCHYLAHHLLDDSSIYKQRDVLLPKLKAIHP
jgi:hypothetical protein